MKKTKIKAHSALSLSMPLKNVNRFVCVSFIDYYYTFGVLHL